MAEEDGRRLRGRDCRLFSGLDCPLAAPAHERDAGHAMERAEKPDHLGAALLLKHSIEQNQRRFWRMKFWQSRLIVYCHPGYVQCSRRGANRLSDFV
jgi:hypothetical protein